MLGQSAVIIGTPVAFGGALGAYRRAPEEAAAMAALVIASLELLSLCVLAVSRFLPSS